MFLCKCNGSCPQTAWYVCHVWWASNTIHLGQLTQACDTNKLFDLSTLIRFLISKSVTWTLDLHQNFTMIIYMYLP